MKGDAREPSPFEKFRAAVRKALSVPKAEIEARDEAWRREQLAKKKRPASGR